MLILMNCCLNVCFNSIVSLGRIECHWCCYCRSCCLVPLSVPALFTLPHLREALNNSSNSLSSVIHLLIAKSSGKAVGINGSATIILLKQDGKES